MANDGFEFLMRHFKFKTLKREVPFLSRCIDLVAIDENDEVISIEFKVEKWKHALEQASDHRLGADKAYICIPNRKLTPTLKESINNAGVGLLLYNPEGPETISEVIAPPKNGANLPVFKKLLIHSLQSI